MDRRQFLEASAAVAGSAWLSGCGAGAREWPRLRLRRAGAASRLERAVLEDAAGLLSQAIDAEIPIVPDTEPEGRFDLLVACPESSSVLSAAALPESETPGAFRISESADGVTVAGVDPEGARNGLYRLLELWGFRFFRDGETIPALEGRVRNAVEEERAPAFRWRGDMIWDNYLGPRRYCASLWGRAEWEQALLFLARNGLNFLEFYPPLERVLARAFPEAVGLTDGPIFEAEAKYQLAREVLERGRELGIRFMYVLGYGAFPEPIRKLYAHLEWRNGFCCAHQPELRELTARTWEALVEALGTDHLYAIRHRGEEEQVYSDPCRSVTKHEGFRQAFEVMAGVDPEATVTVWTWGERLPDLFEGFPDNVVAAHIRHGMANVFGDRGAGREQSDGRPALPDGRRWMSGQFTVFGGGETLLRTGWSDASSLARDAAAARAEGAEGFFQWPEWSNTSPWLSDVIAKLSWEPTALAEREPALRDYARARHGPRADPFLAGFGPLLSAGNARFMAPPRKRLLVPYFLAEPELVLLASVREGAGRMAEVLSGAGALFRRDFLDLFTWVAARQAQVLEAEAYLHHLDGDGASAERALSFGDETWSLLQAALSQVPELSIVESARRAGRVAPLADAAVDSFWELACDFYRGYPFVMGPEAIAHVYREQLDGLRRAIAGAETRGETVRLAEPGWFWHDFPDEAWAEAVRRLPDENAEELRRTMRAALTEAIESPVVSEPDGLLELELDPDALRSVLSLELPAPRSAAPVLPPAEAS